MEGAGHGQHSPRRTYRQQQDISFYEHCPLFSMEPLRVYYHFNFHSRKFHLWNLRALAIKMHFRNVKTESLLKLCPVHKDRWMSQDSSVGLFYCPSFNLTLLRNERQRSKLCPTLGSGPALLLSSTVGWPLWSTQMNKQDHSRFHFWHLSKRKAP